MRRWLMAGGGVAAAFVLQASPAFACGGLVAPDGDVHLDKATTFVAWHAGVEHYVTSFAYSGTSADVGWIVPLPAIPQSIQPAGRWTLQRLELQFNPVKFEGVAAAGPSNFQAVVIEHVQVEALDVTVLKGSGQAVIDWCEHNGFLLPPETSNHLLRYAEGSPIFMAAKYDAAAAQQRGLRSGDGVPLLITMRTPQLWVPLEVLANDNAQVNADLFLLTDARLQPAQRRLLPLIVPGTVPDTTVDGATGFTVAAQQPMSPELFANLSSDRNMGWVPSSGWLTYLRLDAPSEDVTYDLGVGGDSLIRLALFGTAPARAVAARSGTSPFPYHIAQEMAPIAGGVVLLFVAGWIGVRRLRRENRNTG